MAKTKDALKILDRVTGNNESVKAGIVQARINFEVAQMIYDARTKAGLSQGQLAALIGSKQRSLLDSKTQTTRALPDDVAADRCRPRTTPRAAIRSVSQTASEEGHRFSVFAKKAAARREGYAASPREAGRPSRTGAPRVFALECKMLALLHMPRVLFFY